MVIDDNDCVASEEPDDEEEEEEDTAQRYAFPELDQQIRKAIEEYGAVFPKLNFSSPRVWLLLLFGSLLRLYRTRRGFYLRPLR